MGWNSRNRQASSKEMLFENVSVDLGQGEYEARIEVLLNQGVLIIKPLDPNIGCISLHNDQIEAYDDSNRVDTVTLDVIRLPGLPGLIQFRFPSPASKANFVLYIRRESTDDSGNSSSSSEEIL